MNVNIQLIESEVACCRIKYPDWRTGQAYFNIVHTYYPDIAEQVRGTKYDCFYDDSKIEIFKQRIIEL